MGLKRFSKINITLLNCNCELYRVALLVFICYIHPLAQLTHLQTSTFKQIMAFKPDRVASFVADPPPVDSTPHTETHLISNLVIYGKSYLGWFGQNLEKEGLI